MTGTIEPGQHIGIERIRCELDEKQGILAILDRERGLSIHVEHCAGRGRFAGSDVTPGAKPILKPFDEHLDLAATGLVAEYAGRDDACIVEDQQVTRVKQVGEVGNAAFSEIVGRVFFLKNEQARVFAWLDGAVRDEFGGECVIE